MAAREEIVKGSRRILDKKQSFCSAAKTRTDSPRRYKPKRPGEVSSYAGAGILPVCRYKGQLYILVWQPQTGNRSPTVRWYDFGGKKASAVEYTISCATRKFAKQTYGVFGLEFDFRSPEIFENIQAIYSDECAMPLLLEGAQRWAKGQCTFSHENYPHFYNILEQYHMLVLPVPFVPAELLDEISATVDFGKRCFIWLTPEEFQMEAMVSRVSNFKGIHQTLKALSLDTSFCEEGGYDASNHHQPSSSFGHQRLVE
eukprot:GEMP01055847.1.p1 GENE.GEMP01055847.1~~GEMP01055847.1.p1  ORF type:complete len:257 (+),score=49.31 GEMP01055847.1:58-828(+)